MGVATLGAMPASHASVATEKPAPYMKQLCKHFGHKVDVTFDDQQGTIEFAMGRCDLDATQPGVLRLDVEAPDAEGLERTQQVIGSHLERFGRRDELSVSWA
jgi:hypothetical protein